jgi:hypothetical protein
VGDRVTAKKTTKAKMGRPKVSIDWDEVGELLEAGATAESIALAIGIDTKTLYNRCEADTKVTFSAFSQQKKARGIESLRVKQYQVAMEGDKTMLIWLGKQRLGQSDKTETKNEHTILDTFPEFPE